MKRINSLVLASLLSSLTLSFTACGDDDDSIDTGPDNPIVGDTNEDTDGFITPDDDDATTDDDDFGDDDDDDDDDDDATADDDDFGDDDDDFGNDDDATADDDDDDATADDDDDDDVTPVAQCDGPDGCFDCPEGKTELYLLVNACTDSSCSPFNNKTRLPKLNNDGSLPPLP